MPKGMKNLYTCQSCGGIVVTIDRDEGTTPFMILHSSVGGCKDGFMYSSFYAAAQGWKASYEWFKPTDLSGYDEDMLEHIRKGGLDLRKIQQGRKRHARTTNRS